MNTVDLKDNLLVIRFSYQPHLVALVRSLPGRIWYKDAKVWTIPLDYKAVSGVDYLARSGFQVSDDVYVVLDDLKTVQANLTTTIGAISLPLYDYQREIVEFMAKTGSCLNASFVGSGKTITSFGVAQALGSGKNLVVAPKSVVGQWKTEGLKFMPQYKYFVVEGSKQERQEVLDDALACEVPYFLLASYEIARIELPWLLKQSWDMLFCDEAHRLSNVRTQTYKSLAKIQATRKYALTATPVMNSATDMYGIMNFLRPGILGNYYSFLNYYVVKDYFGGVKYFKNMQKLAEICQPYIIRKSLDEVSLQLPEKTETDIEIDLSDKERKLYEQIKMELLDEIEKMDLAKLESPIVLQNTLVKTGKLFELCDHLSLLGDSTESSKLAALKEHIADMPEDSKIIIISRFKRMVEILAAELAEYSPLVITGETQGREEIIRQFDSNTTNRILIGTEAIGQGLNLQMANILYNYDLPWNPARLEQREGRIFRNGQKKPVFIYNLIVKKSVDTWLRKKISNKASLSRTLLMDDVKEMLHE